MLNSQPMGFYSPSQLVQDAKRHGVEVRRVDVMHSDWDCTLEGLPHPPAVRLGLRLVAGLKLESGQRIVSARREAPFDGAEDLARRARLEQHEMTQLASADALMSLAGHRRQQVWEAAGLRSAPQLLREAPVDEEPLELAAAGEGEEVVWDYAATGLTLRRHPLAILRPKLAAMGWKTAAQLHDLPTGRPAWACGLVTVRQQPETAKGVMFVSLEDETGNVQIIVWPKVKLKLAHAAAALAADGGEGDLAAGRGRAQSDCGVRRGSDALAGWVGDGDEGVSVSEGLRGVHVPCGRIGPERTPVPKAKAVL